MSPKVADSYREQKRQDILQAAMAVFIRKGYSAATMKDIVEESGLSRGGVYLYFGSTEEMMMAILQMLDRQNEEQIRALSSFGEGSVWKEIERFIMGGVQDIESMAGGLAPSLYEFYLSLYREGRHQESLHQRYETAIALIEQLIRIGVEREEFKPIVTPRVIASMWINMMDGMMLDSCMMGPGYIALGEQLEASLLVMRHLLGVRTK